MNPIALVLVVTWLGIALLGFGFAMDDLVNCRHDEAARLADARASVDERQRVVSERSLRGAELRLAILGVFIVMGLIGVASMVADPTPQAYRLTQLTSGQAVRGWSQVAALYVIEVMTVLAVLVNWRARHKFPVPLAKAGKS